MQRAIQRRAGPCVYGERLVGGEIGGVVAVAQVIRSHNARRNQRNQYLYVNMILVKMIPIQQVQSDCKKDNWQRHPHRIRLRLKEGANREEQRSDLWYHTFGDPNFCSLSIFHKYSPLWQTSGVFSSFLNSAHQLKFHFQLLSCN